MSELTAEPWRERVLAAVVDQLKLVNRDRSTVWRTSPREVVRRAMDVTEASEFPLLAVMEASGSTLTFTVDGDNDNEALYDHRFRFVVWGFVRGDDRESRATLMERLWDDHMRCLLADPTLGLGARTVGDVSPYGERSTDEGAFEPMGLFQQVWEARGQERVFLPTVRG